MDRSSASSDGFSDSSLDCSIYVDSENREAIFRCVEQSLGGGVERYRKIETSALELYVAHNDYEIDLVRSSDFICWPSVLECTQPSGSSAAEFMDAIGRCLDALWKAPFRAVAACDFEDRLPYSGGIDVIR